jgi:hypothetical protein
MAAKAARERLEHTRRELLRHMSQDRAARSKDSLGAAHPASREQDLGAPDGPFRHDPSEDGPASLWRTLQHTARAWWQSHPAHLALEVAEPLFDKCLQLAEDALAGAWPAQCDQTCPDGAAGKPEPQGEDDESDAG